ncbi:flagellar hook-length control protein FliK [Loktanella sp. IMCC34160]|uniref:flagellar hook-length control protein FliK n=1 Tax=Loktanella sp. IMCC34160 TaxID=2510646 RepID=UPI0013E9EA0F|nr:flagellar hook-length control protein FliK [Loktanella sp. IMCC34160]
MIQPGRGDQVLGQSAGAYAQADGRNSGVGPALLSDTPWPNDLDGQATVQLAGDPTQPAERHGFMLPQPTPQNGAGRPNLMQADPSVDASENAAGAGTEPDESLPESQPNHPRQDGPSVILPQQARADEKAVNPTVALPFNRLSEEALIGGEFEELQAFPSLSEVMGQSVGRTTPVVFASPPAAAGAEVARQVASQIAVAAQSDGSTEIALDPVELGKVKLRLTGSEHGMSVLIIAERPETADLMRRHVEMLAQEFRDLGYSDLQFQFESGGEHKREADQSDAPTSIREEPMAEAAPQPQRQSRPIAGAGGLDLRL